MTWRYVISTGHLYDPNGKMAATGWSGHSQGKNNPNMIMAKGVGPIPPGVYTIGDPKDPPDHLGPCAMPLIPAVSNHMFGRGDFFIHGANPAHPELSSDGCLIFTRDVRQAIYDSDDDQLIVTIKE